MREKIDLLKQSLRFPDTGVLGRQGRGHQEPGVLQLRGAINFVGGFLRQRPDLFQQIVEFGLGLDAGIEQSPVGHA